MVGKMMGTIDHLVICRVALIFVMTRWVFFWSQRFLKYYICKYSSYIETEPQSEASAPDFSLEIPTEKLRLTTFGEIEHNLPEGGSCKRSCAVCLECFRKKSQVSEICNCGHVFHRRCLDRWLRYDARMTCPLCRTSLVATCPEDSVVLQQQQQPSWAVERILYLFGDDLLSPTPNYSCSSS